MTSRIYNGFMLAMSIAILAMLVITFVKSTQHGTLVPVGMGRHSP